MWSLSPPVFVALLAGVCAVSLASGVTGYKLGRASGDKDVRKMLEAGQKILAKRDEAIKTNLEKYREDILVANNRPPKRVLFCPASNLPEAPGGVVSAGTGKPDNYDYGPDLRAVRDALVRCNALIEVVK